MALRPSEMVFRRLRSTLGGLASRLPDGRTLAEIAPSHEEGLRNVEHVAAAVRRWSALAVEIGPESVFGVLACTAGWRARRWWGTPWWPDRVDAFLDGLGELDRHVLLSEHGVDRDRLGTMLRDGPDLMDVGLVRACLRAGLGDVTVAAEPIVGHWFRQFALLSEPDTPAGLHRTVLLELQAGGGAL
jgi:hypothetical protein